MDRIRYFLQALPARLLFALFGLLPLDMASKLGGMLGRVAGLVLRKTARVARTNLALAFPEKSEAERRAIAAAMWDHLGRVLAEFSHLNKDLTPRVAWEGVENVVPGRQALFISGHIGNWELSYPIGKEKGVGLTLIYRHANNPWMEKLICGTRAPQVQAQIAKGARGALPLAKTLKRGDSLALLVDQKMNEGMPVPFFGRDAMTATAVAQFALRFNMPIIPARIIRLEGARFRGIVYPPLAVAKTGDEQADIRAILTEINAMLERWIREEPAQWFWVHRRWGKEVYTGDTVTSPS